MIKIIVYAGFKFRIQTNGSYFNETQGTLDKFKVKEEKESPTTVEHKAASNDVVIYNGIKFRAGTNGVYSNSTYGLLKDYKESIEEPKESKCALSINTIAPEDVLPITDEEVPAILEAARIAGDDIDMAHPAPTKKRVVSDATKAKISKSMKKLQKAKREATKDVEEEDTGMPIVEEVAEEVTDNEESI